MPTREPRLAAEPLGDQAPVEPSSAEPGRPAEHPRTEPQVPPATPADPLLGEPAFMEPELPADIAVSRRGPPGPAHDVRPTGAPEETSEPHAPRASAGQPTPARESALGSDQAHRPSAPFAPAQEPAARFGSSADPDTAFGPGVGAGKRFDPAHEIDEGFGSALELSAARWFDIPEPKPGSDALVRVEPTLDPDAVTVTGAPKFLAGDDDPGYAADAAAAVAGTSATGFVPTSDEDRRTGARSAGGRGWYRFGLTVLAIALVLAGGIAAIVVVRLTAPDVPASELNFSEIVGELAGRAAARLREFGLLP